MQNKSLLGVYNKFFQSNYHTITIWYKLLIISLLYV